MYWLYSIFYHNYENFIGILCLGVINLFCIPAEYNR